MTTHLTHFDNWIERLIRACCKHEESCLLAEFQAVVELCATRDRPRGVRASLERLGFTVTPDDIVLGLRLKRRSDFPPTIDLSQTRSEMLKKYLRTTLEVRDDVH